MNLADIFPDEDYRFHLRSERSDPADFFAPTPQHADLIAQRKRQFLSAPRTYAALLPEGEPLLAEAIEAAHAWNNFALPPSAVTPWQKLLALGEFWEADYLLLKPDANNEIRLYAGCLCFPSSWRLTDKIGQPMSFIHGRVPGLNESIGPKILKFLAALKPDVASLRLNWGLSRSAELDHHPDRTLPKLDATVRADEVWLRVENQALVALPKSGGMLFGIRIDIYPLTEVKADKAAATRLHRALETMPEEMARYKGIAPAREKLLELLGA